MSNIGDARGKSGEASEPPDNTHDSAGAAARFTQDIVRLGSAIARSTSMRKTLAVLQQLARTDIAITLIGETGSGKDVLARAVHAASGKSQGNFVVLDCAGTERAAAESELIGHERGAFSGATSQYVGAFERAHGGTLFIDQVGELPVELQPRLLRLLETRKVRRLGGSHERVVDVRVISSSDRELESTGGAPAFRQDLYFRLAASVVRIPPLRERSEDVPLLVGQLLVELDRGDIEVTPDALEWLCSRAWPGNVRELKNALSHGLALVASGVLCLEHLSGLPHESKVSGFARIPLAGHTLARIEQAAIEQTLAFSGGNKAQAARMLGIAVSTLYEKLKRYQIA